MFHAWEAYVLTTTLQTLTTAAAAAPPQPHAPGHFAAGNPRHVHYRTAGSGDVAKRAAHARRQLPPAPSSRHAGSCTRLIFADAVHAKDLGGARGKPGSHALKDGPLQRGQLRVDLDELDAFC